MFEHMLVKLKTLLRSVIGFPIYIYKIHNRLINIERALSAEGIKITDIPAHEAHTRLMRMSANGIFAYHKQQGLDIKLHVGCGTQYKEGWVNIDNNSDNNISHLDLNWDLSLGIPFPENSVKYIYNEHFLEHLTYNDGLTFLHEVYRVLTPGGTARISMPDLDSLIQCYIDDSWRQHTWVKRDCPWFHSKGFMLNSQMDNNLWGHLYLYNSDDFNASAKIAGFHPEDIVQMSSSESNHLELKNLETRIDELTKNYEITKR